MDGRCRESTSAHAKYLIAYDDHRVKADADHPSFWEGWNLVPELPPLQFGEQITLRSHHGFYLGAAVMGRTLSASYKSPGYGSSFTIRSSQPTPNGRQRIHYGDKVAIVSQFNKFLQAESNGNVNADPAQMGRSERWVILNGDDLSDRSPLDLAKPVSFRSVQNGYLLGRPDGSASADAAKVQEWERWTIFPQL
ncbi:MAG: hypothetical protein AAFN81_18005 [Bacteroidota bacterium]